MKPIALLAELEVEFIIFNRVQKSSNVRLNLLNHACAVAKSTTHKSPHRVQWKKARDFLDSSQ